MPAEQLPNNPYARPVNATRPEGQMLVGAFYGERARDKQLAGLYGRDVSPANRYSGRAVVAPVDMDGEAIPIEPPKPKRGRPPGTKNRVKATIDDIAPLDEIADDSYSPGIAITEDDLFG